MIRSLSLRTRCATASSRGSALSPERDVLRLREPVPELLAARFVVLAARFVVPDARFVVPDARLVVPEARLADAPERLADEAARERLPPEDDERLLPDDEPELDRLEREPVPDERPV